MKKKSATHDDFAPVPGNPILVEEDGFDKTIARLLKISPVGIYEIKFSRKLGSKKPPSSRNPSR
jgi:hypothetical protein